MYISFLSVVFYNILVYIVKIRFSGSKGFTSIIKIYYKHSIFEWTCPFQPMFSDSLVVHVFMIYLLNRLLESGIVVFLLFSSLWSLLIFFFIFKNTILNWIHLALSSSCPSNVLFSSSRFHFPTFLNCPDPLYCPQHQYTP